MITLLQMSCAGRSHIFLFEIFQIHRKACPVFFFFQFSAIHEAIACN